jgi:UDP-N-acetylmuramyl tripeptide synthase
LGVWECAGCKETRPKTHLNNWPQPITGLYNLYNTLASVLTLQILKLSDFEINTGFKKFHPAFGRQEVFEIDGKRIIILLTKNPVGMNVAIRSIIQELKLTSGNKGGYFLLALNDLTPDGRDVSWIWDVDLEELVKNSIMLICSGIRSYDLGVCIKYAGCKNFIVETNLLNAIKKGLHSISPGESLYILPTYSAMLEVRKILTGKKI